MNHRSQLEASYLLCGFVDHETMRRVVHQPIAHTEVIAERMTKVIRRSDLRQNRHDA